jgi:hypothetical protein
MEAQPKETKKEGTNSAVYESLPPKPLNPQIHTYKKKKKNKIQLLMQAIIQ